MYHVSILIYYLIFMILLLSLSILILSFLHVHPSIYNLIFAFIFVNDRFIFLIMTYTFLMCLYVLVEYVHFSLRISFSYNNRNDDDKNPNLTWHTPTHPRTHPQNQCFRDTHDWNHFRIHADPTWIQSRMNTIRVSLQNLMNICSGNARMFKIC